MKYFTLIILLVFVGLSGCSSESELTDENVRTAVLKCFGYHPDSPNQRRGMEFDPIFIENNRATVGFPWNTGIRGEARFMKDSRGDWYLERLIKLGYSSNHCPEITPLLVE